MYHKLGKTSKAGKQVMYEEGEEEGEKEAWEVVRWVWIVMRCKVRVRRSN